MKKLINSLINDNPRPKEYAPSTAPFWNDEHISKGMLDAHLNPDWDAATRPLKFVEKSVAWIHSIYSSNNYPDLLDLGCGPGVYAERFHSAGYNVTGVDLSARSIQYAKEQANQNKYLIKYLNESYTEMVFDKKYDVITLIYCDYPVLSKDTRIKLLKEIHTSLKQGGAFIFDVFTPNFYENDKESTYWYLEDEKGFWSSESHLCLARHLIYDNQVRLDETIVISENSYQVYRVWDTAFTVESISKELEEAGFNNVNIYGDVAGAPYEQSSKTMCIVAKKEDLQSL